MSSRRYQLIIQLSGIMKIQINLFIYSHFHLTSLAGRAIKLVSWWVFLLPRPVRPPFNHREGFIPHLEGVVVKDCVPCRPVRRSLLAFCCEVDLLQQLLLFLNDDEICVGPRI